MIAPYSAVLDECVDLIENLKLTLEKDEDYGVSFSRDKFKVEFSTERYYQPSLMASVIAPCGDRYEMGLLKEVLTPRRHAEDVAALDDIKRGFKHNAGLDLRRYVEANFRQLLDFLISNEKVIFDQDQPYRVHRPGIPLDTQLGTIP